MTGSEIFGLLILVAWFATMVIAAIAAEEEHQKKMRKEEERWKRFLDRRSEEWIARVRRTRRFPPH